MLSAPALRKEVWLSVAKWMRDARRRTADLLFAGIDEGICQRYGRIGVVDDDNRYDAVGLEQFTCVHTPAPGKIDAPASALVTC